MNDQVATFYVYLGYFLLAVDRGELDVIRGAERPVQ